MRARRPDLATRGDHGHRNETRHGSSQRGNNVLDETRPCDSQRASSTSQSFIHFLASVAFLLPSEPPCRHSPTRNTYSLATGSYTGRQKRTRTLPCPSCMVFLSVSIVFPALSSILSPYAALESLSCAPFKLAAYTPFRSMYGTRLNTAYFRASLSTLHRRATSYNNSQFSQ